MEVGQRREGGRVVQSVHKIIHPCPLPSSRTVSLPLKEVPTSGHHTHPALPLVSENYYSTF